MMTSLCASAESRIKERDGKNQNFSGIPSLQATGNVHTAALDIRNLFKIKFFNLLL